MIFQLDFFAVCFLDSKEVTELKKILKIFSNFQETNFFIDTGRDVLIFFSSRYTTIRLVCKIKLF